MIPEEATLRERLAELQASIRENEEANARALEEIDTGFGQEHRRLLAEYGRT